MSDYITTKNMFQFDSHVSQKYHSDGALYKKYKYTEGNNIPGTIDYDVRCEEFFYNYNNLTNKYASLDATTIGINPEVNFLEPKTVWRYRYNPFGEREQKRLYQSPLGDTNEEFYPWVYYMHGIDNRQYATYYGVQSNDNGVLSDDNWSQIARLDPGRPMTFFYPAEYNVYGNEQAPRITYRYVDGNWQKQFKFYDYLGSLRFTMKTDGTLLNFKQYSAFGETTLDTLGVTRQGYIGKEKDPENNLVEYVINNRKYVH